MKTLSLIIIFFMMYLIIRHLLKNNTIEGLANCSQDQDDLTYQNTATIEQQQTYLNELGTQHIGANYNWDNNIYEFDSMKTTGATFILNAIESNKTTRS